LIGRRFTLALLLASAMAGRFVSTRLEAQRAALPDTKATPTPAKASTDPSPVSIRINAVVTDARGRAVVDLKPGEFTLDDNGVSQKLTSVELRSIPAALAGDASPVTSDAEETRAAREPGTRTFAIFLDEFNVSPGPNSARVREAAAKFLSDSVRPHDLVYVMKPMESVTGIRFARDRGASHAAIDSFEGRKGDYEPRSDFERQYIGRTPGAVDGARAQIVTTGLRELTMKLGDLEASRAAVILISEGFVRGPGGERRRLPDWESLARAASHFNIPIYTIDPRDAPPPPPAGETATPDRAVGTLQSLALRTGGSAVTDARDLGAALSRISRDLDAYYVLTYQPSQATDGRFHPITVKTTRKGADVRVPTGYWSPLSSEWRSWLDKASAPPTPIVSTRALRRSRFVDTWIGFQRQDDGKFDFLFTWEPNALGAALRSRPKQVLLKVSTPDGNTLFEQPIQAIGLPGEPSSGDRALVPVASGRLQIDLSILAADGTQVESAAQDIEVPAPRGTIPIVLQPQFVRTRTAREFRSLSADPTAAPTPARVFSRSERLLIRVPAYNPDGAAVTTTVGVVNLRGQTIRPLDPLPLSGNIPQFDLPLAFLAPGEYSIDVKVTSPTGNTRQLVGFRIIG
jgi:VWFA-related protein